MKKSGISLITLAITIVVLIILASVTILALSSNHPINSAKVATAAQTRESINSAVSVYLSNVHAKTLGEYSTSDILIGNNENNEQNQSLLKYRIIDSGYCYIRDGETYKKLYKLTNESTHGKLNIDVKGIDNKSDWYIDNYGKVFLVYETIEEVTSYLKENDEILSTVSNFVKLKVDESEVVLGPKRPASISFESAQVAKTYAIENVTFTNELTNTGDAEVVYSSSDETVATVNSSSGEVTIIGAGTATITATVDDTEAFVYSEKEISYELVVSQMIAQISFTNANMEKNQYDSMFNNHLENTGDGVVTYSSDNEAVATVETVNGNVLITIVGPGSTTIRATVTDTENCTYLSNEATFTLTVNHVHTESCYIYHVHSASCGYLCGKTTSTRDCGKTAHTHSASCGYSCGKSEHSHNSSCGYACGRSEHSHNSSCGYVYACGKTAHTHSSSCTCSNPKDSPNTSTVTNQKCPYCGTNNYQKTTLTCKSCGNSVLYTVCSSCLRGTGIVNISHKSCSLSEHTHSSSCGTTYGCGKSEHTHSSYCGYACGKTAHTHSASCGYACGLTVHSHTSACNHVHSATCGYACGKTTSTIDGYSCGY